MTVKKNIFMIAVFVCAFFAEISCYAPIENNPSPTPSAPLPLPEAPKPEVQAKPRWYLHKDMINGFKNYFSSLKISDKARELSRFLCDYSKASSSTGWGSLYTPKKKKTVTLQDGTQFQHFVSVVRVKEDVWNQMYEYENPPLSDDAGLLVALSIPLIGGLTFGFAESSYHGYGPHGGIGGLLVGGMLAYKLAKWYMMPSGPKHFIPHKTERHWLFWKKPVIHDGRVDVRLVGLSRSLREKVQDHRQPAFIRKDDSTFGKFCSEIEFDSY